MSELLLPDAQIDQFEVSRVDVYSPEFQEILAVRFQTAEPGLQVTLEQMQNSQDFHRNVLHILARHAETNEAVAALRLRRMSSERGFVSRVRVVPEMQHRGVGNIIMQASDEAAISLGISGLSLIPRPDTEIFYAKNGYVQEKPGVQRSVMRKTLA